MTFEQMNEPTPETTDVSAQPPADEEFAGDADLGGGQKPNRNVMLLSGLAVVGVAVVWFMFFRGSPPAAQAALPADGGNDIKQFLDSGNINLMKQTLKDTADPARVVAEQSLPRTGAQGRRPGRPHR
jgi:hypothetical protein